MNTNLTISAAKLSRALGKKVNTPLCLTIYNDGSYDCEAYRGVRDWLLPCQRYVKKMRTAHRIEVWEKWHSIQAYVYPPNVKNHAQVGYAKCNDKLDVYQQEIGVAIAICRALHGENCNYREIIGLK